MEPLSQQLRQGSPGASSSTACPRHIPSHSSRSFASQPAYAYEGDESLEDHTSHHYAQGAGPGLMLTRSPAALQVAPVLDMPPWDALRELRFSKLTQYRRELYNIDQWSWSGQVQGIPFMGRTRFDPRTLHGPWLDPASTWEDLEQHVDSLAGLPRLAQQLPPAAAGAEEGPQQQQPGQRPSRMFEDPADLSRFKDPNALLPGSRGYSSSSTSSGPRLGRPRHLCKEEREAAAAAAATAAAERQYAAQVMTLPAGAAPAPPLPAGLPPPAGARCWADHSAAVPAVLAALGAAGVETDRSVEATLRRHLAKVDLEAQVLPRREIGDKLGAPLTIKAESAAAMANFLLKDLCISMTQFRRILKTQPWVLGLDLEAQVRPGVECLKVMLDMPTEQIARMVAAHPRVLVMQVDEHLLPLLDYMQSLGFTSRHMRRMLCMNPVLSEHFMLDLLRTCVAFWMGKGMSRHDLVGFLTQFPKVVSLTQTLVQIKFDWLREHIQYEVEDHARNPILLSRSLTETLGPRIAFALHKGFVVHRPTDSWRRVPEVKSTTAKEITQIGVDTYVKRLKSSREEFLAFKEHFIKEELPAWLAAHGAGLDQYQSIEWLAQQERGRRKAWEQPVNGSAGSSSSSSNLGSKWAHEHGTPAGSTYEGLFSDEEEQLAA
ncbi:hypothetical protein N2152v2_008692 [Parachlorella kessleri]